MSRKGREDRGVTALPFIPTLFDSCRTRQQGLKFSYNQIDLCGNELVMDLQGRMYATEASDPRTGIETRRDRRERGLECEDARLGQMDMDGVAR